MKVGDTVEVVSVDRERPTGRWFPVKVMQILYHPKSEKIREVEVFGEVEGEERRAWVLPRYLREIETAQ